MLPDDNPGDFESILNNLLSSLLTGSVRPFFRIPILLFGSYISRIEDLNALSNAIEGKYLTGNYQIGISPFKRVIKTAIMFRKSSVNRYLETLDDTKYQQWWGWHYYLRGLDTHRCQDFEMSYNAFNRAYKLYCEQHSEQTQLVLSSSSLARLFPLTEIAVMRHKMGNDLNEQIKLIENRLLINVNSKGGDQNIRIRHAWHCLAYVRHRMFNVIPGSDQTLQEASQRAYKEVIVLAKAAGESETTINKLMTASRLLNEDRPLSPSPEFWHPWLHKVAPYGAIFWLLISFLIIWLFNTFLYSAMQIAPIISTLLGEKGVTRQAGILGILIGWVVMIRFILWNTSRMILVSNNYLDGPLMSGSSQSSLSHREKQETLLSRTAYVTWQIYKKTGSLEKSELAIQYEMPVCISVVGDLIDNYLDSSMNLVYIKAINSTQCKITRTSDPDLSVTIITQDQAKKLSHEQPEVIVSQEATLIIIFGNEQYEYRIEKK